MVLVWGFVLLGQPIAVLGIAWPAAAAELARPIGDLGLVTFVFGAGYTVSTLAAGRAGKVFGGASLLISSGLLAAAGLVALGSTEAWWLFLIAAFLLGVSGGQVDAVTNSHLAVHRGSRAMGMAHAGFGLGTIAGPLLVTILISYGTSWRIAYLLLALLQLLYSAGIWRTGRPVTTWQPGPRHRPSFAGRGRVLGLSLSTYLFLAALEAGTGAWAYSVLTLHWGLAEGLSGLAVTGYWAMLTVSRVVLSLGGHRWSVDALLRWSVVASVASLLLFWLSPWPWLVVTTLVVSGGTHGTVFPLEMLKTAQRFGSETTPHVIGYEVAAANVGVGLFAVVVGALVNEIGLGVVPAALFIAAVGLGVSVEGLRSSSRGMADI